MSAFHDRLVRAFERVLPGVGAELGPDASMDTVPRWDSLSYVQLIVAIENEFQVKLGSLEAARMRSVPAIRAVLAEHGETVDDAPAAALPEWVPQRRADAREPMIALLERRWAMPTGRGRYAYAGGLLTLMDAFDRLTADHAHAAGAVPHAYPTTVSTQSLIDSGYLKSFPQHAYFVGAADELERVMAAATPDGLEIAAPDQVLAPTVCYHCMEALRGRTLDDGASFTAVNPCHRREDAVSDDLARVETFRMRELVGFGTEAQVASMLDAALEASTALLRRLDLAHRVVMASDPFFGGAPTAKQEFQRLFMLKRELLVRLDHDDRWIAVASFNHHRDSLVRAFDIGAPHSGCVGWGLERLAYALLSRHGDNAFQYIDSAT